jgi:hypothetical protein
MALGNYRDISVSSDEVGTGFQFEFACAHCPRKWKSAFKPYRVGQLSNLMARFGWIVGLRHGVSHNVGSAADMGAAGARDTALEAACVQAARQFSACSHCGDTVCEDCWSTRDGSCKKCAGQQTAAPAHNNRTPGADRGSSASPALACPNCRTALNGGRFCAECGFDMASTHKTCPSCGTMVERQTRFCGDCGHSF